MPMFPISRLDLYLRVYSYEVVLKRNHQGEEVSATFLLLAMLDSGLTEEIDLAG